MEKLGRNGRPVGLSPVAAHRPGCLKDTSLRVGLVWRAITHRKDLIWVSGTFRGHRPGLVSRSDLANRWPLTVDYGLVRCRNQDAGYVHLMIATFIAPDGTTYALNGTAKTHTEAADIDPIWTADPRVDGFKVNIGDLIDLALQLC